MKKKVYKIDVGKIHVPEKMNTEQLALIRRLAKKYDTAILLRNGQKVHPDGTVDQILTWRHTRKNITGNYQS